MGIAEKIKSRREELGLSQQELAEKVGFNDKSSICKIESGALRVSMDKLNAFADALYTTPSYLLGWSETASTIIDSEIEKYAELLHKDPRFRTLLDSSSRLDTDSFVKKLLRRRFCKEQVRRTLSSSLS